jgi:OmpA family
MAADLVLETPVCVAPLSGNEHNTVRERLIPVGAWQVDDFHFEFGSSVILPDAAKEFATLAEMRNEHAGAPLALFGHADPTGNDDLNKTLSGRRALAVYAVLVRRIAVWEKLFGQPAADDKWGEPALAMMRGALGLTADDRSPRGQVFSQYMDLICRDLRGLAYQLDPAKDFLARGADHEGKGDVQGCGEFNPLLVFSATEAKEFAKPSEHVARDAENAPNRRVTGLLFQRGSAVDPERWPCPRASEGAAGCRKRFWSDAASRRAQKSQRRTRDVQGDTFACRFYERIADDVIGPNWIHLRLQLHDPLFRPCAGAQYTLELKSGGKRNGVSGDDGWVSIAVPPEIQIAKLHYQPADDPDSYTLPVRIVPPGTPREDVYLAHLRNLGFVARAGDNGSVIMRFQVAHGKLVLTGELDDHTCQAIDKMLDRPLDATFEAPHG